MGDGQVLTSTEQLRSTTFVRSGTPDITHGARGQHFRFGGPGVDAHPTGPSSGDTSTCRPWQIQLQGGRVHGCP